MIVEETIEQQESRLMIAAMEELDKIVDRWHAYLVDGERWVVELWRGMRFRKVEGDSQLNALKQALIAAREMSGENYEFVDHPEHYGGAEARHEAISVIEEWGLGFHLGNVVKYISRAGKKPDQNTISDLQKARWYLDRYIENLENESGTDSQEGNRTN